MRSVAWCRDRERSSRLGFSALSRLSPGGVVLLLLLVGFLGAAPLAARDLRVVTYNIHHGEGTDQQIDLPRLAGIIRSLEPDLVALQEVDRGTLRSRGVDQARRLAELTGMQAFFGRALYYAGGEYGVAILSRFPITRSRNYPLPYRPGFEPRTALAVWVEAVEDLPPFVFVSTHLCHRSPSIRVDQTSQLRDLFPVDDPVPVILAGDFNARSEALPMSNLLRNGWQDATESVSRIDYILIRERDSWEIEEVKIVEERVASDHDPILLELEWKGD